MDVGDRRIGLAIAEEKNHVAVPLGVIANNNMLKDELKKILDDKKIGKIVVGVPYTLKGETGRQARKVFDFVEKNLRCHDVELIFEDERFTSSIPLRNIRGAGTGKVKGVGAKRPANTKKTLDRLSACIILQGFLDKSNAKNSLPASEGDQTES